MMRSYATIIVSSCISACLLFLSSASSSAQDKSKKLDGKTLFEQKCLKCHKPEKFKNERHDRRAWEQILNRMQLNTCQITEEESAVVADYLAKTYGE